MKTSKTFMSTLREVPAEAVIASHQLMLRAGLLRKLGNGLFTYLPLGLKAFRKVENIIREEMNAIGAMEFKKRFEEDRESAWNDYLKLCNAGGSLNYLGLLKVAGLSVPFSEGSVEKSISYAKEIVLKNIGE